MATLRFHCTDSRPTIAQAAADKLRRLLEVTVKRANDTAMVEVSIDVRVVANNVREENQCPSN